LPGTWQNHLGAGIPYEFVGLELIFRAIGLD